ncbi:MAG: hypothetical protein WCQ44_11395, partial [Opitutaceae bacterium]
MPASPATSAADDFVIQLVLEHGLLDHAQVARARDTLAGHNDLTLSPPRLMDILVTEAGLDMQRVAALMAAEFGLPLAPDLGAMRVGGDVLGLV